MEDKMTKYENMKKVDFSNDTRRRLTEIAKEATDLIGEEIIKLDLPDHEKILATHIIFESMYRHSQQSLEIMGLGIKIEDK